MISGPPRLKPGYAHLFWGLFSAPGSVLGQAPLVRVHPVVAQVEVAHAVEVTAAGLADHVDRDRALGMLGAVVRLQHLELADHVRVGVDRRRAVAAGVGGVGAVDDDVEAIGAGAVAREVADRALLAAVAVAVDADDFAVVAGIVDGPAVAGSTGNGVIPGSSLSSSPVLRPTIGTFWICSAVRRALSPESTGAMSGRDVTEITSSTPPTLSVMPVTVRRWPSSITMSEASQAVNPASSTRTP